MGYGLIVARKYGDLPDMFITLCNLSGNLVSWNWIYIENHSNVLSIVSIQIYYIYIFGKEYSKLFDSPTIKHPPVCTKSATYKRYESCAFVNGNIKS